MWFVPSSVLCIWLLCIAHPPCRRCSSAACSRLTLQSIIWKGRPVLLGLLKQIIFKGKLAKRVCHLTHSISGKVELVDQCSINLCFSFLNLLDSPASFSAHVADLDSVLCCHFVSFRIPFVHSDSCKGKQSSNHCGEDVNSDCL